MVLSIGVVDFRLKNKISKNIKWASCKTFPRVVTPPKNVICNLDGGPMAETKYL